MNNAHSLMVISASPIRVFYIYFGRWAFSDTCNKRTGIDTVGKVIYKNQLDATIIYWSTRSAQHVSGNLLPIFRSVRLRFLQHMVFCCCGRQGFGELQGTSFIPYKLCHAAALGTPAYHNNRTPYAAKISVLRSWRRAKDCPKHVELIL